MVGSSIRPSKKLPGLPPDRIIEPIRALELADTVAPYNPFFFEEPVRPESIQAMAHLRRKMTIPLGNRRVPVHDVRV